MSLHYNPTNSPSCSCQIVVPYSMHIISQFPVEGSQKRFRGEERQRVSEGRHEWQGEHDRLHDAYLINTGHLLC